MYKVQFILMLCIVNHNQIAGFSDVPNNSHNFSFPPSQSKEGKLKRPSVHAYCEHNLKKKKRKLRYLLPFWCVATWHEKRLYQDWVATLKIQDGHHQFI